MTFSPHITLYQTLFFLSNMAKFLSVFGRLTAKFQKNLYRPHKAYIFLSIFSFLYIGFLGFLCYNGKGGIDYESEYIKI